MGGRTRVAFVDDEANILTALRRAMLTMLDEWEMAFFSSATDLLAAITTSPFDVVVSDMRMPGIDGGELMDRISHDHPATVRVILCGYEDTERLFRAIGPAHIYLIKPCSPQALQQAIRHRIALRCLLHSDDMRRVLGGLTSLPSAPDLFLHLVRELRSPRCSSKQVADIIGSDVAMTAALLKLTNSSYFAVAAKVTTPLQAVRILGIDIVQTLVLQLGVFRQFQGANGMAKKIEALNGYSQVLGALAEQISLAAGDPDSVAKSARCAALLSVIGSLILLHECTTDYADLLSRVGPDNPLHVAEIDRFGAEHSLIGAYLLSLWGFSDKVVQALSFASVPSRAGTTSNPLLTALHLARVLGPPFPLLSTAKLSSLPLDRDYLTATGKGVHMQRWLELAVTLRRPAREA